MAVVAVVGLGAMGSRIARRLLGAGHELVVWNRSPDKAEELVQAGATRAGTPAEAARRAEAVITMLASPSALGEVTQGADGVAAGADGSTSVIEMSTVGPEAVARLAELLGADVPLLDAPVLGSLTEVEDGKLSIFVGGPEPLFERWKQLFEALGSPFHVGPLGSGAAAKLVANTTLFGVTGVLGEALALAHGLGLPLEKAFDVLARTPLSTQAGRRRPAIESGEFPRRFPLALARKDADLIRDAATAAGVDLRLTEAARSWIVDAAEAGAGDEDYAAVLQRILRRD